MTATTDADVEEALRSQRGLLDDLMNEGLNDNDIAALVELQLTPDPHEALLRRARRADEKRRAAMLREEDEYLPHERGHFLP